MNEKTYNDLECACYTRWQQLPVSDGRKSLATDLSLETLVSRKKLSIICDPSVSSENKIQYDFGFES